MNTDQVAPGFADLVAEKLSPIHRGVILIGKDTLAVFGNDGYRSKGIPTIVAAIRDWLISKGFDATDVVTCGESYTWSFFAKRERVSERIRLKVFNRLWKIWKLIPNEGRTSEHAGEYQYNLAATELYAIGGGYTDATLAVPFKGKGGPVRGNQIINHLLLMKAAGGEDVFVLLGGIPYPARVADIPISDPNGVMPATDYERETIVLTENVGDPREEGHTTSTAYFAAGHVLMVAHFGEIHEATGRRILTPIDPMTGKPLID